MAVPKYNEMFPSIIRCLSDGQAHPLVDLRNQVISDFGLTDEDVQELLPSGTSLLSNRIGWARTYLKRAGLIEQPARNAYLLSDEGRKAAKRPEKVTLKYLMQYESFRQFVGKDKVPDTSADAEDEDPVSPE